MKFRQNIPRYVMVERPLRDDRVEEPNLRVHAPGCSGVHHRIHAKNFDQQFRRQGGIYLAHAAVYRHGGQPFYIPLMEAKHCLFRNPANFHIGQKRGQLRVGGT